MATAAPPLNRQARLAGSQEWTDMGPLGLIEAAERFISLERFAQFHLHRPSVDVEVRDCDEPDTVFNCRMRRVPAKYVCVNPRGEE